MEPSYVSLTASGVITIVLFLIKMNLDQKYQEMAAQFLKIKIMDDKLQELEVEMQKIETTLEGTVKLFDSRFNNVMELLYRIEKSLDRIDIKKQNMP